MRRLAKVLSPVQPRRALLEIGKHLSARGITRATLALGALEQGRWLAASHVKVPNVADRFAVFDEAIARIQGVRPLYLEFGVYRGRTLRYWARHLRAPEARFVGFDSFQGLPEDWELGAERGTFSVGKPPEIDDPRVSFVVGWFDQTVQGWEPPEHDQLVVNVDCDLYSSTKLVLDWVTPRLRRGDLVYFDDLLGRDHEWRALQEWLDGVGRSAEPRAMARWGQHMLFEMR